METASAAEGVDGRFARPRFRPQTPLSAFAPLVPSSASLHGA